MRNVEDNLLCKMGFTTTVVERNSLISATPAATYISMLSTKSEVVVGARRNGS